MFKIKKSNNNDIITITFNAKFEVFQGVRIGPPKNLKYNEWFRCDFSTGVHLLVCQITYFGSDEMMQENKWYDGQISIIGAGNLPPFDTESKLENLELEKEYWLHSGLDVVGKCKLISPIKIIRD